MCKFIDRMSNFWKDRSGVAAVEFALFAPFLLTITLVMGEVGLMTFDKMKLTSGVRSASQYVLVGGKDSDVMSALVASGSGLSADDLTIEIAEYCDCAIDEVSAQCFSECSDGGATRIYRHITAKTVSSRLFKSWALTSEAEVRVR